MEADEKYFGRSPVATIKREDFVQWEYSYNFKCECGWKVKDEEIVDEYEENPFSETEIKCRGCGKRYTITDTSIYLKID